LRARERKKKIMSENKGGIELIIGPMFSGKTSQLRIRVLKFRRGRKNKKEIVILKWDKDYRGDEKDSNGKTHDKVEFSCIRIKSSLTKNGLIRKEILEVVKNKDVIGIDDGHFWQEKDDLITFCEILANMGKLVIVAALDGDFRREPFIEVLKLIPKCEYSIKLLAVCGECGSDAPFTLRKNKSTKIIEVGGEDDYEPACRKCHSKKYKK
jgi:thymidine kinase